MEFSVTRSHLLSALQKVEMIVEKKNTIPILGNIFCSLEKNQLFLYSTNLEIGIQVICSVRSEDVGKMSFPAKHLLDIVKELPDEEITITTKPNYWIELICLKSKFNIIGFPPDQYPALTDFENKTYHSCQTYELKDLINRIEIAIPSDPVKYNMLGVFFESLDFSLLSPKAQSSTNFLKKPDRDTKNFIRMTAMDGHRLSYVDHPLFSNSIELKKGIIIPKKGLTELRKLLELEKKETVQIAFERNCLYITFGDSFLFIRLIEAEYPNYNFFLPKELNCSFILDRNHFLSALKRVSLFTNEKSRAIRLLFQRNTLFIDSIHSDIGAAQEEIQIEYEGEPFDIMFSSNYLLDCLTVMKTDQLELHLKDRRHSGSLLEFNGSNHTYVLMPMRL